MLWNCTKKWWNKKVERFFCEHIYSKIGSKQYKYYEDDGCWANPSIDLYITTTTYYKCKLCGKSKLVENGNI